MKVNKIKIIAVCAGLSLVASCTDNFESINSDQNTFSQAQVEQDFNTIKGFYPNMEQNVNLFNLNYQVTQNLGADTWGGYTASPTPFASGSNNTTYNLIKGWTNRAWDYYYRDVIANAYQALQATDGKYKDLHALALIIRATSLQRLTDIYGPIVYSKYGTTDPKIAYDSQSDVYVQLFKDLDIAVADLSTFTVSKFAGTDMSLYKGDYKQWIKYANSLRLRMAMRIVKINPTLAKTEAEKAIANPGGVLEAKADACIMESKTTSNPLKTISGDWDDTRMSADMESIMGGYNDPRLASLFQPTAVDGVYKGIRTGINIVAKSDHTQCSKLGSIILNNQVIWMTPAQVYFLRAEGVLRGWNMGGGTARSYYEKGIQASFDQLGVSGAAAYIANATNLPKDYVDTFRGKDANGAIINFNFPANNATAVNNVTVAWDETATNEVKLQKIITQKWIASFPDGQEAWSEWRRTGYPKLFVISKNTSGGLIDSAIGVRRQPFAESEAAGNPLGLATGLSLLGGPDTGGTRVWWDTTGANF